MIFFVLISLKSCTRTPFMQLLTSECNKKIVSLRESQETELAELSKQVRTLPIFDFFSFFFPMNFRTNLQKRFASPFLLSFAFHLIHTFLPPPLPSLSAWQFELARKTFTEEMEEMKANFLAKGLFLFWFALLWFRLVLFCFVLLHIFVADRPPIRL